MEYVIPNEAMQNPTAAPIINTIEAVRRQGRLRDFDFTQAFSPAMRTPGYATGGAIGVMPEMDANIISTTSDNKELIQVINRLSAILAAPIRADVSLMGRNGFLEKYAEYERMKNRGQIG